MGNTRETQSDAIMIYNRRSGCMEREKVLGDGLMRFAYQSPFGKLIHWPLFATSCFSRLLGGYANSPLSKGRIAKTVKALDISLDEVEMPEGGFACFNDFFARKLKAGSRPLPAAEDILISPADCRLLLFPELKGDECIPVKGASFTVPDLLASKDPGFASVFRGGALCVCRLCPADYHRFHFPDSGTVLDTWRTKGNYHSVHPLALTAGIRAFTENVRQISILESAHFGKMAYIEVGAFGVASIQQTFRDKAFSRGDEKGFFAFGGSTVILIFQPGKVRFSQDLLEKSSANVETLVRFGDPIGSALT